MTRDTPSPPPDDSRVRAVLGPTNTGKTHLAIERMCGHSSGMMGFPLRLLAREVYDRVRAIKGDAAVALITGEQRIEPPDARYFCCTAEAMNRTGAGPNGPVAFVALDEAQIGADPERGHVFTDRLLNARGREETMILGSATLEPMVRQLIPRAEMVERPRFSTLTHSGMAKLSRLPPRSAVVAFSVEQVYAMAEALRRFRGGAAVVMGALSPETRNKQVELFQNGEVDYIVATDAIGMGLNLDLNHVAFAALSKFDGRRKRRLTPAEMAQIAGRAGRHQRDGSFGTLTGGGSRSGAPLEFTEEEIYAIEEHRFAPITDLYWREAEPRYDSLDVLIEDLESSPPEKVLKRAPEAIDLAVLKRLANEPVGDTVRGPGSVRRFWEVCSLPDFRQVGLDSHARFCARLWQDLRSGYIGADFVAARIAELDRTQGDIDTLQGRIAAIRSWAYICQRPDWVLARDEMAARARAAEAKLSDALHARLTERFVNRRTTILMKSLGQDGSVLPVTLEPDGGLNVEGETIGRLDGFRFVVDPNAGAADRKMLLAAGEKALPGILSKRAQWLLDEGLSELSIEQGAISWQGRKLADIVIPGDFGPARLELARDVALLPEPSRGALESSLSHWLAKQLEPLEPMRKLAQAARDPEAGSEARALLITLIEARGTIAREDAGLQHLPKEMRPFLRKLGVTFGALDVFASSLLKPAPRQLLHRLALDSRPLRENMLPVLPDATPLPAGYRHAGSQLIRVDLAEKILRAAFEARSKAAGQALNGPSKEGASKRLKPRFRLDLSLPVSIGLAEDNARRLLGSAGFRLQRPRPLSEGVFGPPAPERWTWNPRRGGRAGGSARPGANRSNRSGGRKDDRAKQDQNRNAAAGKPQSPQRHDDRKSHGGKPRREPARGKVAKRGRPQPRQPDTGPARAGGAFDKLADLLRK